MTNLTHRKARIADLPRLIELLLEDELGATRESKSAAVHENYIKAFNKIESDPNQYLMVVENGDEIIATCHLTIMPSLTFMGSTRMQIEAVRTAAKYRGQGIGSWMFTEAISYGKAMDVSMIQLTTNKNDQKQNIFMKNLALKQVMKV
ncbi:MAG: GNAT family N-acetyltransferase [Rickettsiaceae bacterium]|nr:GNAT family N-acetyltransferase [Rickettsiaceae bacterium]